MKRLLLLTLLLLYYCAPKEKVEVTPLSTEIEEKIAAADALYRRGCYVPLRKAFLVYGEVYGQPGFKKRVADKLAMTSLLIAVREKELGIDNRSYMDVALELIKENASLAGLLSYAEIAGLFWVQGKGVMRDIDEKVTWKEMQERLKTQEKLKKMETELRKRAQDDEFFAYMYAVMKCHFSSPFEKREDLAWLEAAFPDSLLIKYKMAICPEENEALLRPILDEESEFFEVAYNLGNLSLGRGNLLEAESHLLRAHQGITESPQITILLASIYLALEELERSLDFYEKTLAIAPEYRDALLGKAICLSYAGRHDEAIPVLEKIIALGHWLIGESYYWLAWNQHELKKNDEAAENIEQAKSRLPTSSEVFTLSGIIALERGDLVKAEKDLKEALEYNPANSEALFNLGSLYAGKEDWQNSGAYFGKAAFAFETDERALRAKIAEAEKSALSPERKEKFLRKKRVQLERTAISRATAFYNAAAGYLNAGQKPKALEMATKAADHPSFKEKAEELISRVKTLR
ncbi:MAG: tetratricopeptide repeat protein [Clostridiales bacterium]|nr:tetratricopeptide repeat protein [Clostridiales bacterium]